jgi:hypothetical protein
VDSLPHCIFLADVLMRRSRPPTSRRFTQRRSSRRAGTSCSSG